MITKEYRYFNRVLEGLVILSRENINLPDPNIIAPEIRQKEGKVYLYFKDGIGATDGTHIPARVPTKDMSHFRNRKGDITQNVLGICTFSLYFCCIVPRWEESAHDGPVLQWALGNGLVVPEGKYFLVDAGYALKKGFLTPYRSVRYHLREQSIVKLRLVKLRITLYHNLY